MLTLGFVIIIFAGFVRAGSSTSVRPDFPSDQSTAKRKSSASASAAMGHRASGDSYWHQIAAKRLRLLGRREHRIVSLLVTVHKLRGDSVDATGAATGRPASIRSIICQVFGSQCSKALSVAWCESRFNIYARNGQYLGLFQMGEYARDRYGHGWDALTQARAAYRYYLDAGWSPWSCA